MANALAVGAGASTSLEDYLMDMLKEKAVAETGRHNQAGEALSGRQIDETAAYRKEQQRQNDIRMQQLEDDRKSRQNNMLRDDTRASLDELLPGAQISPETRDKALKTGAALPERFKSVQQFPDDFIGPIPETGPQRGETTGYELQGGKQKPPTDETFSHETMLINGKPEDVRVGGKTNKIIMARTGQPPPDGAKIEHYEKPPSPDRVLIQSGDNYIPRSDAAKTIAGGGQVPLGTPAQTRNRQDLAQRVSTHFDDAQELLDEAEQQGALGPVAGRTFTDFMAGKVGSTGDNKKDELLGELRQNLSLLRSGTAQLHGRGGANVGIIQSLEKNMDEGHMSYSELTGALRQMKKWVDTYASKPGVNGGGAGPDAYQQYLDRGKKQ